MTATPLSVSVVVPVFNAARTLPACLAALEALDPKPFEILVIDNGSTDGSATLAGQFAERHPGWVHVIVEHTRGASVARNTGAKQAKGDILAFTDADCTPYPDWLTALLVPFADGTVGAVAGRITAATDTATLPLFSALYTLQSSDRIGRHQRWTPTAGGFPTANLAVRREVMERLHGFDESVAIYGEDYDLCARLYAQGHSLVYRPDAIVRHHHRIHLRALLRQAFGFGRSHAYLLRKHAAPGLWLEWPRRAISHWPCPVRSWINVVSADKKLLWLVLAGGVWSPMWWLLPCYGVWLAWDARCRASRVGASISAVMSASLAALHVLKAGAMTLGRWYGSAAYRVMCF